MKAVFAKLLYTGAKVENDVYLLFEKDKVHKITDTHDGKTEGEYEVITPALIDPHAHIGMVRAGEPAYESETNEKMESILAHADALDSVQMDDTSFQDSIEEGVLYTCIVPGSGNIIGGKSAVVKNYGRNTNEALIGRAGIKVALGYNPMSTKEWKGSRPYTRMGALALLRQKLFDVRQKIEKKREESEGDKDEKVSFTVEEEILRSLLEREDFMRVHVHKIDDIASLLRLVEEFDLRIVVDHAGDVNDGHIFDELKARDIPVVYGPIDSFAYKVELRHENWRNIRHLLDSEVRFGLMTDHPVSLQKMLLYQLRWFIRCGLSKVEALQIATRSNAEILGIDSLLGTLEKGKWASFVCWSGDPFDISNHPIAVYGEGSLLYSV
jgi:imidazolonepropionase-like amidohydrolase